MRRWINTLTVSIAIDFRAKIDFRKNKRDVPLGFYLQPEYIAYWKTFKFCTKFKSLI